MATDRRLTDRLKAEAPGSGFDRVGVAPAVVPPGYGRYLDWLEAGRAAGMAYLRTAGRGPRAPRARPRRGAVGDRRGHDLRQARPDAPGPTQGKVARYARGADYHDILWRRLDDLLSWLQAEPRGSTAGRSATRRRSWSATSPGSPGWAGSARTPA